MTGLSDASSTFDPDVADNEVHVVGFDQLFSLLPAHLRPLLIVLVDHLDRQGAHLAAEMIEREFEGVAHVAADHGRRTAERTDKADLDALLLRHGRHA
jgi:nucleoside-diphosphate-sugar epimerase